MTLDSLIQALQALRAGATGDEPVQLWDPDGNGECDIEDVSHFWSGDGRTLKRIILNPADRPCDEAEAAEEAEVYNEAFRDRLYGSS